MIPQKRQMEQFADLIDAALVSAKLNGLCRGGTVRPGKITFDLALTRPYPPLPALATLIGGALNMAVTVEAQAGGVVCMVTLPASNDLFSLLRTYSGKIPPACATLGTDLDGAPILLRIPAPEVGHVLIAGPGAVDLLRAMCASLSIVNSPADLLIAGYRSANAWAGYSTGQLLQGVDDEIRRRDLAATNRPFLVVAVPWLERADPKLITRILLLGANVGIHLIAASEQTPEVQAPGVFRTVVWGLGAGKFSMKWNGVEIAFDGATVQRGKHEQG